MMYWNHLTALMRRIGVQLGLVPQPRRRSRDRPRATPTGPIAPAPPAVQPDPAVDASARRERARNALIDAISPALPVENRDQLLGREAELERIFSAITDLRSHALIYGSRGAGKTSLVRAFGDYADERGLLVLYLSCDDGRTGFAEIFKPYLDDLPDNCFERGEIEESRRAIAALAPDFGPRALAAVLSRITEQRLVLIVDEFDRVSDPAVRADIATLVKQLSDMRARVHLLFVGIARDAQELIDGHASLRRHLVAVGLRRFAPSSANALLDEAERRAGLLFEPHARAMITGLAAGSPYHLRLFAFTAGMAAITQDRTNVTRDLVLQSLPEALENWAALNPSVASLFERAAREGPVQRRRLEALALTAVQSDFLTVEEIGTRLDGMGGNDAAAETIARMRPALVTAGDSGLVFEDTLAPQFLLLNCCFAECSAATAERSAA